MDHPQERGSGKTGPADHPRGSRFHQRQLRHGGKLMIGSPIGPVLKNGKPMETSSPSTAISYENAYPVKPASMDLDRNNKENTPPGHHQTPSKPNMSRSSRALHVLSSITHTFSRSSLSLASFKNNRNFSGTSGASSIASGEQQKTPKPSTSSSSMRRPLIPRFDTQSTTSSAQPEPTKPTTPPPQPAAEPDKIINERAEAIDLDPKLIYTAQPSAYWSGRFTALRDKYHNELLEPETLHIVLEEHMRRSTIEQHLVDGTNADDDRPKPSSASDTPLPPRSTISILKPTPHSTTTRQTATIGASGTFFTSSSSRPPLSSGLSRIPFNKPAATTTPGRRQSYDLPSRHQAGNMPPPPAPTIASSLISTTTPSSPSKFSLAQRRQTILLTSDDLRRRRVFATLASLCATPAARESLRLWQTAYARRVGKECLLPAGESLVDDGNGGGSQRGRRSGWGGGGRGWKREGSVASSAGTGTEGKAGLVSRLRMFSGGRRSQLVAMEMGQGQGQSQGYGQGQGQAGSVVGGGVVSEP
ncbi:hypothetical protein CONLIGDRAFT_648752 [Coniochaeta ligniaria NRRL 30616]|uniref:Uncharacterized protein n=1 Tax=Coniochaeta ligniaria NRRL 30616 TaxID=1408157 RepID=A0A1J7IBD2_9PEZI|nr:hypothetical protein CONLIGDRAFT_648752 [Coniochaeta ligniaria NRRL 30616]